jgi:primosomal protein N' (replication factor Y)
VVAKGLDFRNVGLTGIISADVSLNIPDYRSPERTFQLITQAAGRAGRGDERGKVIIQTFAPDNYAVTAAAKHDYKAFYRQEIQFRRMRGYPPFSDFIQIIIASSMEDTALAVANEWERVIRSHLGNDGKNVLPNTSMVSMAKDGYKRSILIKCPKGSRKKYFDILMQLKNSIKGDKRKYSVTVDVNPYSMWRS